MKGQTETVKLGLEVLTPVQVGSGANLQLNLDYVERGGVVFVVDKNRTFEALAVGDGALDSLLQSSGGLQDVVRLAAAYHGYELSALAGQGGLIPQSLREFLKDALFRPYIPGSSLKGTIRTALLADWIRSHADYDYQKQLPCLRSDRNPNGKLPSAKPAYAAQRIGAHLFGADPNKDLLRALHVGDASFEIGELRLADIRWLNIVTLGKDEKARWRDITSRNNKESWCEANGAYAEVLPAGSLAPVAVQWDRFLLSNLQAWQAPQHGNELLPGSFRDLQAILNRHALYILDREIAFFSKYGAQDPLKQCETLHTRIARDDQSAYLRLAWGSGWRGMTGCWLDEEAQAKMRKLYRLGKGQKDKDGVWEAVGQFPKTRRLAVQGTPRLPLGWVRLTPWKAIAQRAAAPSAQHVSRHPWLDQELARIQQKNHAQPDDALRGTELAQAWQAIDDAALKQAVLQDIRARWQKKPGDWWANPPGKASKKALALYKGET